MAIAIDTETDRQIRQQLAQAESDGERMSGKITQLRDHLSQALRQWRMYAEMHDEVDLDHDDTAEAVLYRQLLETLNERH